MRLNLTWLRAATSVVFVLGSLTGQVAAQEADRPLLSQEIRTVLERDGVAAAQRRFDEIFPAQKDKYEIDTKGLGELAAEYMKAGDYQSGQAIANMMTLVTQDMMMNSGMIPAQAEASAPGARDRPERETPEPMRTGAPDLGPARGDLARFAGVYGDPGNPDSNRKLFVTASCDGHLVAGAMWGDAQNWWMESASDNTFEMSSDFLSLRLEFVLGPDGKAQAMNHDLDFMPSPLQKMGLLPEAWSECVRRPGG